MSKKLLQRLLEKCPELAYDVKVHITGMKLPDGKIYWNVAVEGEDDRPRAAAILERAADVLRNPDE